MNTDEILDALDAIDGASEHKALARAAAKEIRELRAAVKYSHQARIEAAEESARWKQEALRLAQALRIIRRWAACYDPRLQTPQNAMADIEYKCREALEASE